jgi:hypothetical protein
MTHPSPPLPIAQVAAAALERARRQAQAKRRPRKPLEVRR